MQKNATKNWVRMACEIRANKLVTTSCNFGLLEKLKWPSQVESNLSQIGMMESFINKQNTIHLEVFQRVNDIFHQDTFAGIKKRQHQIKGIQCNQNKNRYRGILGCTS